MKTTDSLVCPLCSGPVKPAIGLNPFTGTNRDMSGQERFECDSCGEGRTWTADECEPDHDCRLIDVRREYAPGELSCPITGCTFGKDHNGPCMDRFGGEGTIEIRERNLMLLMEDDPEEFRRRVRELLALTSEGKGEMK